MKYKVDIPMTQMLEVVTTRLVTLEIEADGEEDLNKKILQLENVKNYTGTLDNPRVMESREDIVEKDSVFHIFEAKKVG